LLLLSFSCLCSLSLNAQIKIKSTGRAQIGNDHPYDYGRLQLGTDGITEGISFFDTSKGGTSARIFRINNILYFIRGGLNAKGLRINSQGQVAIGDLTRHNYDATAFRHAFSIFSENLAIATYVHHDYDMGDAQKSIVYRDRTAAYAIWNGPNTKTCYIQGNGEIYSKGLFITSDVSTKKNIETIQDPLQKIMQLRGVTFQSVYDKKEPIKLAANLSQSAEEKALAALSPAVIAQMNKETERKRIGVVAQEVEAVVPEAVRTTHDGKKAVSYPELVGLLIEAMKEQQVQIEELREYAGLNTKGSYPGVRSSGTGDNTTATHLPTLELHGCKLY
ncbi:MAG: tail fiber domain-containing protein, partial [Bacteroidales bacterium]|nr:tail fiber domain-containing protein [Bacteroidales bacterium]